MREKSFMPLSAAAKANPIIANDELQGKNSSHTGTTQATWKIRLVQVPIWFLLKLLPQHEFLKRRPEHVRFDELLHALIYWNLSFRFVPRSSIVSRSDLDKENVTCVAREKIGVLCCGVVTRYHLAKLLLQKQTSIMVNVKNLYLWKLDHWQAITMKIVTTTKLSMKALRRS
jgi:hypothetical protein